jgi:hypothetical protein
MEAVVAPWQLLVKHNFALGCPLAATVVDAADNDKLRSHVSGLFAQWHTSVANVLVKFGDSELDAHDKATVLIGWLVPSAWARSRTDVAHVLSPKRQASPSRSPRA